MDVKYIFAYNFIFKENLPSLYEVDKMIIEVSFGLVGGVNFGLEKSWNTVENLIRKYPHATWKKIVNWKNGKGKYIVEID